MASRNHTMRSRPLSVLTALTLVLVACTAPSADESPVPARPTTDASVATTLPPTTTTTVPPFAIADSPPQLTELIITFYDYLSDADDSVPAAPEALIAGFGTGIERRPASAQAHLASFGGEEIGVVTAGADTFLVVSDETGWRIVGGVWPNSEVGTYFGSSPRHVAVVGSDARPGQDVERTRADSIHFISLDGAGHGAVVGLPRDSYIPVPGFGKKKATASLALGGPETMMAAFVDLTGLPLEGYLLTGFAGFEALLGSVLGGVEVEVPFPINDRWAHVDLSAGLQLLDGAQALGFARARKTVPGGDLTRSEHQGDILVAAAKMVREMGYPAIPALLEASEPHLFTDMTAEQLLTFSAMAVASDLDEIPNIVAPGRTGTAAGASVVFLDDSVPALFDDLADGHLDN